MNTSNSTGDFKADIKSLLDLGEGIGNGVGDDVGDDIGDGIGLRRIAALSFHKGEKRICKIAIPYVVTQCLILIHTVMFVSILQGPGVKGLRQSGSGVSDQNITQAVVFLP